MKQLKNLWQRFYDWWNTPDPIFPKPLSKEEWDKKYVHRLLDDVGYHIELRECMHSIEIVTVSHHGDEDKDLGGISIGNDDILPFANRLLQVAAVADRHVRYG